MAMRTLCVWIFSIFFFRPSLGFVVPNAEPQNSRTINGDAVVAPGLNPLLAVGLSYSNDGETVMGEDPQVFNEDAKELIQKLTELNGAPPTHHNGHKVNSITPEDHVGRSAEVENLRAELDEKDQAIEETSKLAARYMVTLSKSQTELSVALRRISQLEEDLAVKTAAAEEKQREPDKGEDEMVKGMYQKVAYFESKLKETQREALKAQKNVAAMEVELKKKAEALERANSVKKKLEKRESDLRGALESASNSQSEKLSEVLAQVTDLEKQVDQFARRNPSAADDLAAAKAVIMDLRGAVSGQRRNFNKPALGAWLEKKEAALEKESQIQKKQQEEERIGADVERIRQQEEERAAKAAEAAASVEKQLREMERKRDAQSAALAALEAQRKDLELRKAAAETEKNRRELEEKKRAQAEAKRKEIEEKRQAQEEAKRKQFEEKMQAQAQAEAKRKELEEKRQAQAEAKRKQFEEKMQAQAQAQAKRKELEEKRQAEAEAKRKEIEEKRRDEVDAKRKKLELQKAAAQKKKMAASEDMMSRLRELAAKTAQMKAQVTPKQRQNGLHPELENWEMNDDGEVIGTVKNHPSINDGEIIVTSRLANPEHASAHSLVATESGSKYKLCNPKAPPANDRAVQSFSWTQAKKASASFGIPSKKPSASLAIPPKKPTSISVPLTGEHIGDGKYLLAGKPKTSPNLRSQIWTAYRADADGSPTGEALAAKISSNKEAMERENANYKRTTVGGFRRGMFVNRVDFLPVAGKSADLKRKSVLVMELGTDDLKTYLRERGGLEGQALRNVATSVAQCAQAVHSSNLVWTDLKTENFVVVEQDTVKGLVVKGIDLESAIPVKGNPVDYTPEACPPEFARAFLGGDGGDFVLEKSYDIWSFGMVMYELSTGRGCFDGKSPAQITKMLNEPGYELDIEEIEDQKMRDLVAQCVHPDPKRRPSIAKILSHPYFSATRAHPFSFL